jgi:hypothetical protein
VSSGEIKKYVAVYIAMQRNHSLTIEQAAAAQGLTVAAFRELEQRIERDETHATGLGNRWWKAPSKRCHHIRASQHRSLCLAHSEQRLEADIFLSPAIVDAVREPCRTCKDLRQTRRTAIVLEGAGTTFEGSDPAMVYETFSVTRGGLHLQHADEVLGGSIGLWKRSDFPSMRLTTLQG